MSLLLDGNIPVRTIEVRDFSDDICEAYLRGQFDMAGPVANVLIINQDNKRVGYVTFVRAEDAAKVLGDKQLPFHLKFAIKEAEIGFQPKPDPYALQFEQINDDCMLCIASYLSLIDIINLANTSTRLQALAEQIFRRKTYFSFDRFPYAREFSDSFKAHLEAIDSNLEVVLQAIGVYIETLDCHYIRSNHLDLLTKYCPNVTKLTLRNSSLPASDWKRNKSLVANLEALSICNGSVFDATLKMLVYSSQLKSLELRNCYNYRWKFLSRLNRSKLNDLRITGSLGHLPDEVVDFVRTKKLAKFYSDSFRFEQCATLGPELVAEFEELQLVFSSANDDNLVLFIPKDFKRLTSLTINVYGVPVPLQYKILVAAAQITTLQLLVVKSLTIDTATFNCLGLFENVKKIDFVYFKNEIGRRFYSTLHTHLPNIVDLRITPNNSQDEIESKWIGELIGSMANLKYFFHSSMSWQWLNIISQEQQRLKRPTIEIMVYQNWNRSQVQLLDSEGKKTFDDINKGTVKVKPYPSSHFF